MDTFIVFYIFVLYSVKCLKTCHFTTCFTSLWASIFVSMLILHVTSSWFGLYLSILITLPTHFHTHIQRHTHTKQDQHTREMATTMHRSLVGGGRRKAFVRDKGLAYTKKKMSDKPISRNQKKIEHRELPAKLLDYYLGSNKSNINQSCVIEIHRLKVSFFDCQLRRWLLLCTLFIIIYYQQIRFFTLICIPHQP